MGSVTSGPNAIDTIAMAEMVFGKDSLDKTPAIISLINVNSPLRYDDRMLAALVEYAKRGPGDDRHAVPADGRDVAGLASPATLAQQVGEALAGIALVQTIRPGCPVVFGSFLSNTDMQSGSPSFGTPESAVGLLCTGQIARHYNLPFRGGGALTSSQVVDAQAGYESMMSLWPTFLAGTNFVMHSAGWLESALVSCYEKFVTDVELPADAVRRCSSRSRSTRRRSRTRRTRRWGRAATSSAPCTRSSASASASTGRSSPRPRTTSAGTGTAARDTATRANEIWKKTLEEYEEPPIDGELEGGAEGVSSTGDEPS